MAVMPSWKPKQAMRLYKLTPDQITAWRTAVAPLTARWAAKVDNGDKVLADLKAALQRHGALAE